MIAAFFRPDEAEETMKTTGVFDGDIEPEKLFMHANDHRRWRIAQTIKRLSFSLSFSLIYMNSQLSFINLVLFVGFYLIIVGYFIYLAHLGLLIVIFIIYVKQFDLMGRAQQQDVLG